MGETTIVSRRGKNKRLDKPRDLLYNLHMEVKMRIFNFHIMSEGLFRAEKRKAEKVGHRVALGKFINADKIIVGGHYVFKGKVVNKKLVLVGDDNYIMGCDFRGVGVDCI